jgi:hypothetical protein
MDDDTTIRVGLLIKIPVDKQIVLPYSRELGKDILPIHDTMLYRTEFPQHPVTRTV